MEANFNISNLDLKKKKTIVFLEGGTRQRKRKHFLRIVNWQPWILTALPSTSYVTVNKSLKLQIAHLYNEILKGR